MTVKTLIRQLRSLKPNLPVLVRGYEDGLDEVQRAVVVRVRRKPDASWYNGFYEKSRAGFEAVYIEEEERSQ